MGDFNSRTLAALAGALVADATKTASVSTGQQSAAVPTPPPARPKASNGRTITTREERRKIAASAHQRKIKITGTGRLRQAAKPTVRVCIDEHHIEVAKRDVEQRRLAEQRRAAAVAAMTTGDTVPGRR